MYIVWLRFTILLVASYGIDVWYIHTIPGSCVLFSSTSKDRIFLSLDKPGICKNAGWDRFNQYGNGDLPQVFSA